MRVPLSWLREYAPVPEDARAEQVLDTMVTVGFEEEDVHRPSDAIQGPVVVGQVLSREPEEHSNGKTVNWCQVRVVPEGQEQPLTGKGIDPSGVQGIVCGAHNFEVGDKVVVTLPGAVLPGDFRITPRKTYGHTSAGMIASVRELGIGEDHDGILVLSRIGLDPQIGADALDLLGLYDEAAEINVTPDRGYGFSMRGVAREYSHAVNQPFHDFVLDAAGRAPQANDDAGFPVDLADQTPINGVPGCDRFVTRVVTGINPEAPTPPWMASRLRLAGIRSLSLPVDISNYVMLEFGQPLHFYDLATLQEKITVRRAQAGETLTTLDDKQRTLDPEDLLITDASGPIGIAGVMGGAATEVGAQTTDVLVEAAHFDPITIARSARRHRLPSEASKRFERGVDPTIQAAAAQRAVELLVELAGGTVQDGAGDVLAGQRPEPQPVRLEAGYPAQRVGVEYSPDRIEELLTQIGCSMEPTTAADGQTVWTVTPPSWRSDLVAPEDLAEEVARLDGYHKIPSRLPVAPPGRGLTRDQIGRRRVMNTLAAAGLTEVLDYPFVSQAENNLWGAAEDGAEVAAIKLFNPISEAKGWMRVSLLPGLLDTLRRNYARGFRDLTLFQSGLVFLHGDQVGSAHIPAGGVPLDDAVLADVNAGIPRQPWRVGVVLAGQEAPTAPGLTPRPLGWQDALDHAFMVADTLGVELKVAQGTHQGFHPGRTARFTTEDGVFVGWAGELHPQILAAGNLPERACAVELDLDTLLAARPDGVQAQDLSVHTPATQDVALLVDADLPAGHLVATLREGAGDLLEEVRVFDVYQGDRLPDGQKSVALAMRFRAPDRTLTADEASASREAAVALAAERHGAVLRG